MTLGLEAGWPPLRQNYRQFFQARFLGHDGLMDAGVDAETDAGSGGRGQAEQQRRRGDRGDYEESVMENAITLGAASDA